MNRWLALAAVVALLWAIHLAASARNGFALPEATRERVGASASTALSRLHAHFVAPFFHDTLAHLAYNTLLFAIGVPLAVRAMGGGALAWAYLASPVAGILVDLLLILPLAALGVEAAVDAAPRRLVGASVVAFALLGLAIAAQGGAWWWALPALAAYEAALALAGVTKPFVWSYHLAGLALGVAAFVLLPRA